MVKNQRNEKENGIQTIFDCKTTTLTIFSVFFFFVHYFGAKFVSVITFEHYERVIRQNQK